MSKTTKIEFINEVAYDDKIEIVIAVKRQIDGEDYKTIVDAANTILDIASKYLTPSTPKEDKEIK